MLQPLAESRKTGTQGTGTHQSHAVPTEAAGICAGTHLLQHPPPRMQDWGLGSRISHPRTEIHTSSQQVPTPP